MSERYTRLFSLPENLGLEDCPVVISAGALLKDNVTGDVLAQLKLRNLSPQAVEAVKVKIHAYDTAKAELNGVDTFSYLDLNVPLDGEFGSRTPIPLPDAATRSFTVDILSVTLADGTVYSPTETQAVSSEEILDKVKQLDKERIAQQSEKARRRLIPLSFVTLLFIVISFIIDLITYVWLPNNNSFGFKSFVSMISCIPYYFNDWYDRDLVMTSGLVVPCICILASLGSKRFPNAPKFALRICLLCIGIQVLSAIYIVLPLFGIHCMDIGGWDSWGWVLHHIEGARIILSCRTIVKYGIKNLSLPRGTLNTFFTQSIYLAKNVFAVIILYLHVRKSKNGDATLSSDKRR